MRFGIFYSLLQLFFTVGAVDAIAQESPKGVAKSIDLNEVIFKSTAAQQMKSKPRVKEVTMHFGVLSLGSDEAWDSSFLLTRFESPGDKKFSLLSVEGRVADFDSNKFTLVLAVLQVDGSDTLLREIPIKLDGTKRRRQRYVMDVRDFNIALQPRPFYLGYGFHTKPVKKEFAYPMYSGITGGEAAVLSISDGKWRLRSTSGHFIFPFKIAYLEHS